MNNKTAKCDDCGTEYKVENPVVCKQNGCDGAVFWL